MVAESSQGTGFLLERPSARSSADFGEGHRPRQCVVTKVAAKFNSSCSSALSSRWRRGRDTQPHRRLAREETRVEGCKRAPPPAGALRAELLLLFSKDSLSAFQASSPRTPLRSRHHSILQIRIRSCNTPSRCSASGL